MLTFELLTIALVLDSLSVDLLGVFKRQFVNNLLVSLLLRNHGLLQVICYFVAFSYLIIERFDLESKFVDDTPCNHVFLGQPRSRLCV